MLSFFTALVKIIFWFYLFGFFWPTGSQFNDQGSNPRPQQGKEAQSPKRWTTRGVPVVKILSMLLNFKIQIKDQLDVMTAKKHVTLLYLVNKNEKSLGLPMSLQIQEF